MKYGPAQIISRRTWTTMKIVRLGFAAPMALFGSSAALAQASPSEHASHHPGAAAAPANAMPAADTKVAAPQGAPAPPPAGGMTGMMKGMMSPSPGGGEAAGAEAGCCGIVGGKPFYPAMMNFPALTDKTRAAIRTEAIARLGSGAAAVTAGQVELHRAQSSNDPVAAQAAIGLVRDGVSLAESGNSALQGLNQNQPPPRIALAWFKREMSVTPESDMIMDGAATAYRRPGAAADSRGSAARHRACGGGHTEGAGARRGRSGCCGRPGQAAGQTALEGRPADQGDLRRDADGQDFPADGTQSRVDPLYVPAGTICVDHLRD